MLFRSIPQPPASLEALRAAITPLNKWHLTALAFANGLAGSAIVALALVHRQIDGETAFKAIRVEENWQAARWGADQMRSMSRTHGDWIWWRWGNW